MSRIVFLLKQAKKHCNCNSGLFGPVTSRRMGMSLGVDLVPGKVCSLNCIYCEIGKTTKLSTVRAEYVPYDKVRNELFHYFNHNPDPDYTTFSGAGEPTINSRIGDILNFIKEGKPKLPVAVLTNGTLLYNPVVRQEIMNADLVLPSLDAGTQDTFKRINKPAAGFVGFRKEYKGKIWLEAHSTLV